MQRAIGVLSRLRIMRHHDNRLPMLTVQKLQQFEDFVGVLAVEIARRFVAQQQRWVGYNRTGNGDTLFLAAG